MLNYLPKLMWRNAFFVKTMSILIFIPASVFGLTELSCISFIFLSNEFLNPFYGNNELKILYKITNGNLEKTFWIHNTIIVLVFNLLFIIHLAAYFSHPNKEFTFDVLSKKILFFNTILLFCFVSGYTIFQVERFSIVLKSYLFSFIFVIYFILVMIILFINKLNIYMYLLLLAINILVYYFSIKNININTYFRYD
jgi:hypothetical protein